MRFNARKAALGLPGVIGTARVGTPTSTLLPLLQPGDIAVIDHVDLDRDTATALVDAGVVAVVNAAPMISGRYANLGPEVLAEAGVLMLDQVGREAVDRIEDDQPIRVHDGVVFASDPDAPGGEPVELASGRLVDLDEVHHEMVGASIDDGVPSWEQELVLHARGLPDLTTQIARRPVVVVSRADHADLQAIASFVRDQAPVVVAVGAAANDLLGLSWAPDVVVVTAGEPDTLPTPDALRVATDIVLLAPRGSSLAEQATIEAVASPPHLVDSSATAEDVALLLADHNDAALVVGVGLSVRLEEFLEGQSPGRASSFATRLKVGDRLVDAAAVRALYTGNPGGGQVALVVLAGIVALIAAISVTPVGHDWAQNVVDYLQGLT